MALLQIVVGNIRVNVMNVMKTDIAGEPLEYSRQLEIRATFQRYFHRGRKRGRESFLDRNTKALIDAQGHN